MKLTFGKTTGWLVLGLMTALATGCAAESSDGGDEAEATATASSAFGDSRGCFPGAQSGVLAQASQLRGGPGSGDYRGTLPAGTSFRFANHIRPPCGVYGWYLVTLNDGRWGWIYGSAIGYVFG